MEIQQKQLFGHPRGLYVLFLTEMWERFSFYGMRALLVLFLVSSVNGENPGFGWTSSEALKLYGIYTFLVYLSSIPGGILADKLIGQKKAVILGGLLLVAGHSILAFQSLITFYIGLGLIIAGVGCLKPNMASDFPTSRDHRVIIRCRPCSRFRLPAIQGIFVHQL
jgi:POT family proton-dependent oligopeptide transporter